MTRHALSASASPTLLGRLLGWLVTGAATVSAVLGGLALAPSASDPPRGTVVVVVPHPDDEFQAWSLLDGYTVFVVLTRGEQTQYCDPAE
ncbi:hypothetical protein NVV95_01490 [Herbiconiux sp. CPCC 205716]|uniref:PIG-L family deacetylase n=1 Tax=Herbiconiux gentiana TaxID=2970912 RepID=A0ABT2GAJ0_9MICO|nr:hypothetical protein [Herbiconiux gentiana]MCS5713218.1 hypothetical protein [Herbiconiux gentiana]